MWLRLLRSFSAAKPESTEFETHLVEVIAVAVHQLAAYLYKLDLNLGDHKDIATWVSPKSNRGIYMDYPDGKLPTISIHRQYRDCSQYPNGIADMVGYWAKAQIFGGVVLFDRRKPSKRDPLPDVRLFPLNCATCRLMPSICCPSYQSRMRYSSIPIARTLHTGSRSFWTRRGRSWYDFFCQTLITWKLCQAPFRFMPTPRT